MYRRDFVHSGICALTAGKLLANGELFANENTPGIEDAIDAHVHVWDKFSEIYPLATGFSEADRVPASFTPDELFVHCRPQGVKQIVLIQMNFFGFDNSYMIDCIKKYPGVFSGVAVVDEKLANVTTTMKLLAEQGVRGFRLYADKSNAESWQNAIGMKKMWAYGADAGLAMCLLSNPDALPAVASMCERFPETPVVIDHFSRIGMTGTIQESDINQLCQLAKFNKVFVKTSAMYALGKKKPPHLDLSEMVRRLRDAFGANRLMWGSDCPYQVQAEHSYVASIALFRDKLDFLTNEDKAWMLRDTAKRVFFGDGLRS
jgi:predicted TIM-barrel fold metal-dependent hydrolase